ncbi:hypothetical protein BH24GEM2_BH24GEM2_10020 [soil metagenome]
MADRRRRLLVNHFEHATGEALRQAVSHDGGRVYPKIRIADALDIDRSGLARDEYSYAFKAHFDFVVADGDSCAAFAVEFDETHHDSDPNTIVRDALKNSICGKLEMPLLRIRGRHLEAAGHFPSLIGWLAELFFLERSFYAAQDRGEIPPDEPFIWFSVRGYDPFLSARVLIQNLYKTNLIKNPAPQEHRAYPSSGACSAVATVELNSGGFLVGHAHCFALGFSAVPSRDLAVELAVGALAEQWHNCVAGRAHPLNRDDLDTYCTRHLETETRRPTRA